MKAAGGGAGLKPPLQLLVDLVWLLVSRDPVMVTGTGTQKHDKHRNAGGGSLPNVSGRSEPGGPSNRAMHPKGAGKDLKSG